MNFEKKKKERERAGESGRERGVQTFSPLAPQCEVVGNAGCLENYPTDRQAALIQGGFIYWPQQQQTNAP